MPGELTFRQRLSGFDGAPRGAPDALVALVALAFAIGFLLHPGGAEPAPRVPPARSRASWRRRPEPPRARRWACAARLSAGVSRPARRPARKHAAKRKPAPAVAEPVATAEAGPEATAAPVVATPAPATLAPVAAAPAPAAPKPQPKPSPPRSGPETFDSSG